jgi:hypothetical protein
MPVDGDNSQSVAFGDVDGDGDLDLVIGNVAGQNRLYLNDGSGAFTDATASRMPVDLDDTTSVVLGDVDCDGDMDLVIGNLGGQSRLYLNNGAGTFTDATASRMPVHSDTTTCLVLGDVDGDGDLDMVIGNQYGNNRLYLNNGTGSYFDGTSSRLPADSDLTWSVTLGDVDGDRDLDLVVGNSGYYPSGQQNRLYLNDGTGTFTDATAGRMPVDDDNTQSVALVDVDVDGDLDLVIGNGGGQNRLYLNDGAGAFTDATASRMPVDGEWTSSVAHGDVDGDGDPDLVFGGVGQTRLYNNLQRQLDARYLLRPGQPYTLDIYSRYGPPSLFDVALTYLSTTRVSIPIPPLGILGIDPMAPLPPVLIPQPAGVGTASWNVPNNPALAGIEIFAQALIVHWPFDPRFTNVTADVIQR